MLAGAALGISGLPLPFVEPAILVIMGGVIVTILLSVYLPMFRLMSAIKS